MTKCNQQHILDEKEKLYFPTDGEILRMFDEAITVISLESINE